MFSWATIWVSWASIARTQPTYAGSIQPLYIVQETRITSIPCLITFRRDIVGFFPKTIIYANLLGLSSFLSLSGHQVWIRKYLSCTFIRYPTLLGYVGVLVLGDVSWTVYIMPVDDRRQGNIMAVLTSTGLFANATRGCSLSGEHWEFMLELLSCRVTKYLIPFPLFSVFGWNVCS